MDTPGLSTLFELLPIGAYQSSPAGKHLRANPALVRFNGYASEAEMLAAVNDIADECYVDPHRRAEFQQRMQRDGQVTDFVSEVYRHKTRERLWIRENAHLVRAADGTPLYYEGTIEDIDRQRRTELALRDSERRFRAFTEKSQVLTVVCDAQGLVGYVSPASLRLLGFEPGQLLHTQLTDWVHPDDVMSANANLAAVLDFSNSGEETVCRVRHADGVWRHLAILANNCLAEPAVAGVVLNLRDVSGRARAEEALRRLNAGLEQRVRERTLELVQARDEAESANRAKSEFLSRMSHELRMPMHAILGFAQLLDTDSTPALGAAQHGQLREILRAGERLLALINELLDLERIEAGHLSLQAEAVDVRDLVQECIGAMGAVAQRHAVQLVPPEAAHDCCVIADRERLRQVLLNLLSNAIKHNRRNGRVRVRWENDAADSVRIIVSDTGAGLDAAQKERLFHAFERLGADRAAIEGAGIGLALSKRLVELMQGQIGLDSTVGIGSDFWVRLACADRSASAQGPAVPRPAAASLDRAAPAHTGTLLYIEDNEVNVLLMEAMVEQQTRLRLLSAPMPEAGLEMARVHRPDLILLDIQLPGIDGYEVLRRLRAADETRRIPVIAVSANAMPADIERGRVAGFDDYLTKPIDQALLQAALRKVLPAA